MTIENNFGEIIFKYRNKKKISQETLGALSELDRTYISLIERGMRCPSLKTVFKLSKALDVLPSVLIKELEGSEYEL